MGDTIFDKIVRGELPSYQVWEDDGYLAFLTPFPGTPGQTVVIPKTNPGSYAFAVSEEVLSGLVLAAKKVAKLLEKALNVQKVALVFEGEGVPYLHAKLYPMHGRLGEGSGHTIDKTEFHAEYPGYITTVEGPRMADEDLAKIQAQIREAARG